MKKLFFLGLVVISLSSCAKKYDCYAGGQTAAGAQNLDEDQKTAFLESCNATSIALGQGAICYCDEK